MVNVLLVSIGAAIGAPARFWIDNYFRPKYKFPVGIMIANIVGSFAIGLFVNANKSLTSLFAIGFCGAFTTWSTFVLDTYFGFKNKHYASTAINFFGSLALGLIAVKLGIKIGLILGI